MSWQDVQDFYIEQDDPEEHVCPCGCENNVENCVYASICPKCHSKFYGFGYARRDQLCPVCNPTTHAPDVCHECGGTETVDPNNDGVPVCVHCGTRR